MEEKHHDVENAARCFSVIWLRAPSSGACLGGFYSHFSKYWKSLASADEAVCALTSHFAIGKELFLLFFLFKKRSWNYREMHRKRRFLPPHVAQTPSNATNQNSSEGIKVRSVQRCSLKCSAAAPPYTASEAVVSDLRIFSLSRWMMAPCVSAVPRPDVQGSATASTRGRRYDTPWINHPFITLHTGARTFLCSSLCGGRIFLLC